MVAFTFISVFLSIALTVYIIETGKVETEKYLIEQLVYKY